MTAPRTPYPPEHEPLVTGQEALNFERPPGASGPGRDVLMRSFDMSTFHFL